MAGWKKTQLTSVVGRVKVLDMGDDWDIRPEQTAGEWLIGKVEKSLKLQRLFAGDPRTEQAIRLEFDRWCQVMVRSARGEAECRWDS